MKGEKKVSVEYSHSGDERCGYCTKIMSSCALYNGWV